jgi:hypothetical protein
VFAVFMYGLFAIVFAAVVGWFDGWIGRLWYVKGEPLLKP